MRMTINAHMMQGDELQAKLGGSGDVRWIALDIDGQELTIFFRNPAHRALAAEALIDVLTPALEDLPND